MIQRVFGSPQDGFHWIDLVAPTPEEFGEVAKDYGLHPTSVQDCLDPEHLPKYERIGSVVFIIVRAFDEHCSADADTVQELTRKVALFISDRFLITVHRKDQPFLQRAREFWGAAGDSRQNLGMHISSEILRGAIFSYEGPLNQAGNDVDTYETKTFRGVDTQAIIEDLYFLKRKASVFKRMLRMTQELVGKMDTQLALNAPAIQDLKEEAQQLHFSTEELFEDVQNLLTLHLSLASHRTNEVVRILTLFSVFFMPLTFIVGIYGMNFKVMPELEWQIGYPLIWLVMCAVTAGIWAWFRRKGWL